MYIYNIYAFICTDQVYIHISCKVYAANCTVYGMRKVQRNIYIYRGAIKSVDTSTPPAILVQCACTQGKPYISQQITYHLHTQCRAKNGVPNPP